MDVIKTPVRRPFYLKYWYVIVGMICVAAFVYATRKFQNVTYIVAAEEILIDTVLRGDLSVTVSGYGQLSSKEVYWIGAESDGRIERILVSAGDNVHAGDTLVQLTNPQLLQELRDAELEFDAKKADTLANQITQESLLLDWRTQAANAEIDYQTAKMELDAKTELMANGKAIISRLDYERTQLTVQKYKQRWEMHQQRVLGSEESIVANRDAQQARLLQTEYGLKKIRAQVDGLSIQASVEGIVQEMTLQLGQQISRGENITRIARPDQLVAQIRIQELQVNKVQLGMEATVDTRTSVMEGVVSRIDPTVVDGSVLVEIELQGRLPAEVRPDLSIEATINVAFVENTIYVRRPVFARAFEQSHVYTVSIDGDIAERTPIRYGQVSTNYIEVLAGVEAGDRLIISDPSSWDTHEKIFIR